MPIEQDIINRVRDAVIALLSAGGDITEAGIESVSDLVQSTVREGADVLVGTGEAVQAVGNAAEAAATGVALATAGNAASLFAAGLAVGRGAVRGAAEAGADVAAAAMGAVSGIVGATANLAVDTEKATASVAQGAIDAAFDVGTTAGNRVKRLIG